MNNLNGVDIIYAKGYKSAYAFAKEIGEDPNNTNKILKGIVKPNVKRMLKYAKAMGLSAEEALWLFYPEEMEQFKK